MAAATHTLDLLVLLQLLARNSTNACAVEVGLLSLYAPEAAELHYCQHASISCRADTHLFVALLLPLRDKDRIRVVVLQQPEVELLADSLLVVVKIIYVSRA